MEGEWSVMRLCAMLEANNLRADSTVVLCLFGVAKFHTRKSIGSIRRRRIEANGNNSMVKFATFESTVAQIYKFIGKPKEQLNTLQQTGVSFLGGYIAGIGCAVISHPADVMVSKLNSDRQRESIQPYLKTHHTDIYRS